MNRPETAIPSSVDLLGPSPRRGFGLFFVRRREKREGRGVSPTSTAEFGGIRFPRTPNSSEGGRRIFGFQGTSNLGTNCGAGAPDLSERGAFPSKGPIGGCGPRGSEGKTNPWPEKKRRGNSIWQRRQFWLPPLRAPCISARFTLVWSFFFGKKSRVHRGKEGGDPRRTRQAWGRSNPGGNSLKNNPSNSRN